MRIGKPEENVLKRINKYIKPCRNELVTALKQTVINYDFAASAALVSALNELYSLPADPLGITIGLVLPLDAEPKYATAMLEQLSIITEKEAVPITSIDVTAQAVNKPMLTISAFGNKKVSKAKPTNHGDILIAGYVAGLGSAVMADLKKNELKKVFSEPFIKDALAFKEHLSIKEIAEIAFSEGAGYVFPFAEGGIFSGLWEMAEKLKSGMSIDIRKIPIRQETVELSEVIQINPYLIDSTGAVMIVTDNGNELLRTLTVSGINAALVGTLKPGNDRILQNGEEVRYIDRPKEDEIYRLYE